MPLYGVLRKIWALLFQSSMLFLLPDQVLAEAEKLGLLSVRGNHDDAALAAWEAYHHHGREPAQHRAWVKQLPESGARWLHALPWSLRIPSHGLTVVHAGLVPDVRAAPPMLPALLHEALEMES